MTKEFIPFPKIARWSRDCIVTEKIDGTNASIHITEEGELLTGSRTRWITPEDDNFGFAKWAQEHKVELLSLGVGSHFGEWWGQGIQRNYGLKEKRFSLFNVTRFKEVILPSCVSLVPILYEGIFDYLDVNLFIHNLKLNGSVAVPGFMKPEGIVIYHPKGKYLFKKTIEKDEKGKEES